MGGQRPMPVGSPARILRIRATIPDRLRCDCCLVCYGWHNELRRDAWHKSMALLVYASEQAGSGGSARPSDRRARHRVQPNEVPPSAPARRSLTLSRVTAPLVAVEQHTPLAGFRQGFRLVVQLLLGVSTSTYGIAVSIVGCPCSRLICVKKMLAFLPNCSDVRPRSRGFGSHLLTCAR